MLQESYRNSRGILASIFSNSYENPASLFKIPAKFMQDFFLGHRLRPGVFNRDGLQLLCKAVDGLEV